MNTDAETNTSAKPQETPEGDGTGAAENNPSTQNSPQDLNGTVSRSTDPHQANPPVNVAAPQPATPQASPQGASIAAPTPLQPRVSDRCEAFHKKHKHIDGLFRGIGKRKGKDLSREECDEAYLTKLANLGVLDEGELAEAVMARPPPNPHAPARDEKYARHLAQKAIQARNTADAKLAEDQESAAELAAGMLKVARESIDFKIDAVKVFGSDAPRFELSIEGKTLVLTGEQFLNPKKFHLAFFSTLLRAPKMPPAGKGNATRGWELLVNELMAGAVIQQLPGNATDEEVLQRTVMKMKNAIPEGKDAAALYDDMAYVKNGVRYFTLDAVFDRVRQTEHDVRPRDIALMLERIGCTEHKGFDSGGHIIPAWSEQVATPKSETTTATPAPAPGCTTSASADAHVDSAPVIAGEVLP